MMVQKLHMVKVINYIGLILIIQQMLSLMDMVLENGIIVKAPMMTIQIMNVYFSMLMAYIVKKLHLKLSMK